MFGSTIHHPRTRRCPARAAVPRGCLRFKSSAGLRAGIARYAVEYFTFFVTAFVFFVFISILVYVDRGRKRADARPVDSRPAVRSGPIVFRKTSPKGVGRRVKKKIAIARTAFRLGYSVSPRSPGAIRTPYTSSL